MTNAVVVGVVDVLIAWGSVVNLRVHGTCRVDLAMCHVCVHACACACVCVCACVCARARAYVRACVRAYVRVYTVTTCQSRTRGTSAGCMRTVLQDCVLLQVTVSIVHVPHHTLLLRSMAR